jgi:excisionase family DNA binding protein
VTNSELDRQQIAPLLVDISTARKLLGNVSRTTIYELIDDGKLKPVKIRRRTTFQYANVVALANEAAAA